ncbi:class I SAM-dependent methyltransferase [Erythrobacter sp. EC-HK427]|uniref:class I SAM-dependent methyltransferase n=1 Tax=Erythrobacter sp. EC-HK427 TaxID=2038396 RepID=UPI00125C631C|nr:class I SAM-dependent methyltransferase [Erythrobacter sp. EC-HK427]VVT12808.1 Methyltransferase, UbiE/COQ5 family protein [Erythrobacter sp. EC-HK427]
MTDASEWQGRTGESWATEWRRTDRSFSLLTEQLLAATRQFRFKTVLDVGCGAGELALAIARGRPEVSVTGIDISLQLVDVANSRAGNLTNIRFEACDAAAWTATPDKAPDLIISRHGVMFFDDPAAAFAHLAGQAQSGAGLLFSCFRERVRNPFFTEITRLLPQAPEPAPADAPGPFAFADSERVRGILTAAGWADFAAKPLDLPMIAGAGDDPVEEAVAYFLKIGPAARAAAELDPAARERFITRLRELLSRHCFGGIVSLPAAMWLITARKG